MTKSLCEPRAALVVSGQARFPEFGLRALLSKLPEVDLFLHSWTRVDAEDRAPWLAGREPGLMSVDSLVEVFAPKAFRFDPAIKANDGPGTSISDHERRIRSMFLSMKRADELRQQEEIRRGGRYEAVIRARFDYAHLSPNLTLRPDAGTVYFPKLLIPNPAPCDYFFLADSETMSLVTKVYDDISSICAVTGRFSGEAILSQHLDNHAVIRVDFRAAGFLVRDTKRQILEFGRVVSLVHPLLTARWVRQTWRRWQIVLWVSNARNRAYLTLVKAGLLRKRKRPGEASH